MIKNIKQCSESEINSQIKYLSNTPVSKIADFLRTGSLKLQKGIITSLSDLGQLKTEFGPIGNIKPKAIEGEIKFIVSELVPTLKNNPNVIDNGLLVNIESIAEKEKKNEIEFNITIFSNGNELIIKDGNKRTVAYYENRKTNIIDSIDYPVYIIEQPTTK